MKKTFLPSKIKMLSLVTLLVLSSFIIKAQTNVYDDIIAVSPDHTSLAAAISTAGLESALQNDAATLTVFAPDNDAFDALAAALGTDIAGLLELENLSDILLYHVLGVSVMSADINNGDIVTPLNDANTIKLTKTSGGMVYANQAMVNAADLSADNGYVHSIDAVILSVETVADIAIDNGFTSLTAAVITAELLPALTDPFADYTVFAPDNAAFDDLAAALGVDLADILALPNLADILLYHVLGVSALSGDLNNGDIVTPLNDDNTIKLTVTSGGMVYANQAMVIIPDLTTANGVVHAIDAVILSSETVVDIAIDNGFTTLTAAVVTAELLPALTDPLASYTVFAPDNAAFDDLAEALGVDLEDILALPNLADILLYHVVGSELLSGDLENGPLTMLNGQDTEVDITSGVMINTSTVILPDVTAENGVVHVIDEVLIPETTVGVNEIESVKFSLYPNPATNVIRVDEINLSEYSISIVDISGRLVNNNLFIVQNNLIDVSNMVHGTYQLIISNDRELIGNSKFVKL